VGATGHLQIEQAVPAFWIVRQLGHNVILRTVAQRLLLRAGFCAIIGKNGTRPVPTPPIFDQNN
jgi:hypothetical protein